MDGIERYWVYLVLPVDARNEQTHNQPVLRIRRQRFTLGAGGAYASQHANAISRRALHQAATMARGIKAACRLVTESHNNGNTPPHVFDLVHLLEAQTKQVACLIAVSQHALESADNSVQ